MALPSFEKGNRTLQQSDFPDSWSKECENKQVKVEILLPNEDNPTWIEIPTSNVEVTIARDGTADIQRLGFVEFPTEWDGVSVRNLVSGYNNNNEPFSFCRIWFEEGDNYVLQHFGFVGGVGSSRLGVHKMWVYDLAELFKGVAVSKSWNDPQIADVVEYVSATVNDNTPIQMVNPVIIGPDDVEEYATFAQLNQIRSVNETADFNRIQQIAAQDDTTTPISFIENNEDVKKDINEVFETAFLDTAPRKVFGGAKQFQLNRHTLVDVMNWLTDKLNAKWHIEPTENGGKLVVDVGYSHRPFVDVEVLDNEDISSKDVYRPVITINNNAIEEIGVINTLTVQGEASGGGFFQNFDGKQTTPSKTFPQVTVRAKSLYERTALDPSQPENRSAMLGKIVTSDAKDLDSTVDDAKAELRRRIAGSSEGHIKLLGNPRMLPYDTIEAYEMCNGKLDTDVLVPITYEVVEVEHKKTAGDRYMTTARVSIHVPDGEIEVIEKTNIDIETGEPVEE